ncbi:hypothetical protein LN050_00245 [Comamonadaceae bacterium M7527]|nr:hypothetical protein LN050_00245 [Comamonadaceae bacterium M7527]
MLLGSGLAQAVELGGATVNSRQGEPLQACIEVIDWTPDQINGLQITPAAPGSYAQAGLQYQRGLAVLNIELRRRADGSACVDISTRDPLVGNTVDLLLDVRWASGVSQREFALALDPNTPTQEQPPIGNRLAVVNVQRNDTASQIIDRSFDSFGSGVSANQALIALQRQNPEAFIQDNINLVKAGAALTLPSAEQVQAVDKATANRLVATQRSAFEAYKKRLAANTAQAAVTQDPSQGSIQTQQAATAQTGDRLELKASADAAKALEALAQAQADEAAKQREAAAQQRLNELQALQQELSPTNETTNANEPAQTETPTGTALDVAATPANIGTPLKEVPLAVTAGNAIVATQSEPKDIKAQLAALAQRVQSHAFWQHPQVKNPLFWPIAVALLALLAWLFMPKRSNTAKAGEHAETPTTATAPTQDVDHLNDNKARSRSASHLPNHVQDVNATASTDYSDSQEPDQDQDPLGKAYTLWRDGFQDLAVHTLNQALAYEPDRPDLYMALLEFHRYRGAQLAYEATARELCSLVEPDSPEWAQCCDWGQDLDPSNELYALAVPANLNNMTDLRASDLDLKDKT